MFQTWHQPAVRRALRTVRREQFVPQPWRRWADRDEALPIGCEQTISQPSLVAHMIDKLAIGKTSRVLEIGTGSGYETALLAEVGGEIFTMERLPALATAAQARLAGLNYHNVYFRMGDGARGWPEAAPFDAIIVSAAAARIPVALTDQLKPGGRLVVPVGPANEKQTLMLVEKNGDGSLHENDLGEVWFVPMVSDRI